MHGARNSAQETAAPHVALLVSTTTMGRSRATTTRLLTSMASFLIHPLQQVTELDVYACTDPEQPQWELDLMQKELNPRRTWQFSPCHNMLSDAERRCCLGARDSACDPVVLAFGQETKNIVQFFRLDGCFRHVRKVRRHDFYIRSRPDLQWVAPFDTNSIFSADIRQAIGLRYRSASGIDSLTLGQLQMAWYKVGPDACGEARFATDYACFTVDDQFALMPEAYAELYFGFARLRLTDNFIEMRDRTRVPPCSCWRCSEGRLTEYLITNSVRLHLLSIPATYVYDDQEAAPMLLPDYVSTSHGPDPTWSPSVSLHCASKNGSWGVAAWLARSGIIKPEQEGIMAPSVNYEFSMKSLWREQDERDDLVQQLKIKLGNTVGLTERFNAELSKYAQRYLVRNELHHKCQEPSACAESISNQFAPVNDIMKKDDKESTSSSGTVGPSPSISFIIQYFRHPQQLSWICKRLQDPRIEIIVHADSHTAEDEEAFQHVSRRFGAIIIRSDNVHEIRGYNLAARTARGHLLAFSQDDRMPPTEPRCGGPVPCWIDRVIGIFASESMSGLAALGLHRGGTHLWSYNNADAGLCGDATDDVHGHKWDALPWVKMETPVKYVSFLNIGPIVVRKSIFAAAGGFNTSYSEPGQMGIGFDHELIGRLWKAGWQSAVACPSPATAFRNGCGGKGSAGNLTLRAIRSKTNRALYKAQFKADEHAIEAAVSNSQQKLEHDRNTLGALKKLFPDCLDCLAYTGSEVMQRSVGFANACPSSIGARIVYEERRQ